MFLFLCLSNNDELADVWALYDTEIFLCQLKAFVWATARRRGFVRAE